MVSVRLQKELALNLNTSQSHRFGCLDSEIYESLNQLSAAHWDLAESMLPNPLQI